MAICCLRYAHTRYSSSCLVAGAAAAFSALTHTAQTMSHSVAVTSSSQPPHLCFSAGLQQLLLQAVHHGTESIAQVCLRCLVYDGREGRLGTVMEVLGCIRTAISLKQAGKQVLLQQSGESCACFKGF